MMSSFGRFLFVEDLSAFDEFNRRDTAEFLKQHNYELLDTGTAHGKEYHIYGTNEGSFTVMLADTLGEIGRAYVKDDGRGDYLTSVRIDDDYQRQGIGTKLYAAIEKRIGHKLRPSPNGLSTAAKALWRKRLER
jgi:ribosomal protein S18 acetylase RimI-like enzyme